MLHFLNGSFGIYVSAWYLISIVHDEAGVSVTYEDESGPVTLLLASSDKDNADSCLYDGPGSVNLTALCDGVAVEWETEMVTSGYVSCRLLELKTGCYVNPQQVRTILPSSRAQPVAGADAASAQCWAATVTVSVAAGMTYTVATTGAEPAAALRASTTRAGELAGLVSDARRTHRSA